MKVAGVQLNADWRKGIQAIEPKRQRRIDSTHDDRLDVVEYDLQVGDTGGSYAAKLTGPPFAAADPTNRDLSVQLDLQQAAAAAGTDPDRGDGTARLSAVRARMSAERSTRRLRGVTWGAIASLSRPDGLEN
jgi:hypothetical protein